MLIPSININGCFFTSCVCSLDFGCLHGHPPHELKAKDIFS